MDFGRLGVWAWLDSLSAGEAADFAAKMEESGYSML
jgi:hypothetical protein